MVLQNYAKEWDAFVKEEQLDSKQERLFQTYLNTLIEWNKKHNLTAMETPQQIIRGHFQDSIRLGVHMDMTKISSLADIGSGGGFPGVALKIKFPHIRVFLIEVKQKKVIFLNNLITLLGLTDIEVVPIDWRTFLRITDYDIDLFCARASLQLEELIRVFKPSSTYKDAQLVYWASKSWEPGQKVAPYIIKDIGYTVGNKQRRYIFMQSI